MSKVFAIKITHLSICFAAAVKSAVGGETATQNDVMEAAIKRWLRSKVDCMKAKQRRKQLKQQELVSNKTKEAIVSERATTNTIADGEGPRIELSVHDDITLRRQ